MSKVHLDVWQVSVGNCAGYPLELATITFGLKTDCDTFIRYHCRRLERTSRQRKWRWITGGMNKASHSRLTMSVDIRCDAVIAVCCRLVMDSIDCDESGGARSRSERI